MSNQGEEVFGNEDLPKVIFSASLAKERSTPSGDNGLPSLPELLELVGTAVFVASGTELFYANAEAERITGYTREELKSGSLFDSIYTDDRALVGQLTSELLKDQPVLGRDEVRIVTKSGEVRWVSLAGRPVELDGQAAILGTAIDITARKLAEQALTENEELYRSLVETSPDAIALADMDGRFLMVNQRAAELTGYATPDELVGRDLFEFLAPEDRQRGRENTAMTMERGRGPEAEYTIVRRDGTEFSVAITASRIDDAEGRPRAFLGAIRDLTDRKRSEEAERRVERLESLGHLAGGIAHDFNNILTAILGNIGMARRALRRDQSLALRKLDAAEGSVVNAKRLTQQLLTFSKGGMIVTEALHLGPVLRETAALMLDETGVVVELSLPEELPAVDASPGQIRQVLSNLILNAAQAMPKGGALRIGATERQLDAGEIPPVSSGRYVELSIADEGVGIPADQLASVFDPYFTTKTSGTGLGLSTCYSIMRRHRGAIFVESEVGVGTTFRLLLPTRALQNGVTDESPGHRRGRVLVMDNDEIVRDVAVSMLLEAGFDACSARDSREAVQRYRTANEAGRPFDAVILDLNIASCSEGKETLKKLRTIEPKVKAIVSSGAMNDPLTTEFALFGFQGAVAKPYTFSELNNAVQKVLEG